MILFWIVRSLSSLVVLERGPRGLRLGFLKGSAPILRALGLGRMIGVSYLWDGSQWTNERSGAPIRTPAVRALLNGLANTRQPFELD